MAQLRIQGDELVVRLNPVEKFLAMRRNVHVPLHRILEVSVLDDPVHANLFREVHLGYAARGAPLIEVLCCGPRASWGGGRSLVIVYLNRRSVVIEVEPAGAKHWRLLIVSVRDADAEYERIS